MTRFVGIDPSTKTGICILDQDGNPIESKEVILEKGENATAGEIRDYGKQIAAYASKESMVFIEGFSLASKGKNVSTQFAIGYSIRFALHDMGIIYFEASPTQLKKYASGHHQADKRKLAVAVFKHWGFEHDSDNVCDAFILAQIARAIRMGTASTKYQEEVVQAILGGPKPKKKTKAV